TDSVDVTPENCEGAPAAKSVKNTWVEGTVRSSSPSSTGRKDLWRSGPWEGRLASDRDRGIRKRVQNMMTGTSRKNVSAHQECLQPRRARPMWRGKRPRALVQHSLMASF